MSNRKLRSLKARLTGDPLVIALVLTGLSGLPAQAQDAVETELTKQLFEQIQPESFRRDAELCGFIGYDGQGVLRASKPSLGGRDTCETEAPDYMQRVVSSYHTHGSYSPDYYNEIPSDIDVAGDFKLGIGGWVATPGGRLWYVDTQANRVVQVCGLDCLPSDPKFVEGSDGVILESYTFKQLYSKLSN